MNVMEFLIKLQCPDANGITQTMYRCDLCKKVSKDRSNMKRHMILIHAAPSNLPCPYRCGNVFKNKIYLATHVNSKICLRNQKFSAYWMSFRWLPIRSHRFFLILNLSKLNFLSCQNSKWMKNQSWFPYTINKVPMLYYKLPFSFQFQVPYFPKSILLDISDEKSYRWVFHFITYDLIVLVDK